MERNTPAPGAGQDGPETKSSEISRRTLLQAAVLGTAAASSGANALAQGTPVATPQASPAAQPTPVPPASPTPLDTTSMETWEEPWIWRPGDWPGQQLDLNVVENEDPGAIVGFGNQNPILFSYNGGTPGPSIRMRGDETLLVRLRNLLGQNFGTTWVGPYPDPNFMPPYLDAKTVNDKAQQQGQLRSDFCLGEHTNGVHSARVTNLHTHGLHVRPGRNPDGTHSDNIILRLIDEADLEKREEQADAPTCQWLRDPEQTGFLREDETTGFADYEFRIGNVQADARVADGLPPQPHPPGTHWYHPHVHGATNTQVSSGMAGFLIVEGDVDEAINRALTGEPHPDPQTRAGSWDYLERCMLIQRVFVGVTDPDAPTQSLKRGGGASPSVNGDQSPTVITMRPGAVERWRVLNGSVDGRGFRRFMVVKGQYDVEESTTQNGGVVSTLVKMRDDGAFTLASRSEVEADKQQLYQLAFDGVTLVDSSGDTATYTIQDLAQQNAGAESPLDRELTGNPNQAMLANLQAAFADAEGIRNTFVQPNEVYMAPANRTDVFFQAPRLDGAGSSNAVVYTVLAPDVVVHSDNYQSSLQNAWTSKKLAPGPQDIVVAYIIVAEENDANGDPLPAIPDFDVMSLVDVLPPVPDYLQPIDSEEVRITPPDGDNPGDLDAGLPDRAGLFRTRTIVYSGWGAADYPLVTTAGDSETARNFRDFVARDQAEGGNLENLRYTLIEGAADYVLLPPNIRTMAIAASTSDEVVDDSDDFFPVTASMGRKFSPDDPLRSQMLEQTAEEWALYNSSITLWADTSQTPTGQYGGHYESQPLLRAEGQANFAAQPDDAKTWAIASKAVDHPFHIHQNPFWVQRVEVPDENGNLVNILPAPRWQDVVWIPRNGGRVIFRSRYPDFVGTFVHHCHILLHEDNGMMQVVEVTPFADHANYETRDRISSPDDSGEAVSEIYPRFDQARAWRQSMQFVDINHSTGQKYPGFVLGGPPEFSS